MLDYRINGEHHVHAVMRLDILLAQGNQLAPLMIQ